MINWLRSKEVDIGGTSSNNISSSPTTGFDFTQFQTYFDEQKRLNEEKERLRELRRKREEEEMKRREIMAGGCGLHKDFNIHDPSLIFIKIFY